VSKVKAQRVIVISPRLNAAPVAPARTIFQSLVHAAM
jgi:hypothetical protein